MDEGDVQAFAAVFFLAGLVVCVGLAGAAAWWFLRQPRGERPGIALAVGAGLAICVVAGIVRAETRVPGWVATLSLAAAVAVVVLGVRRARRGKREEPA